MCKHLRYNGHWTYQHTHILLLSDSIFCGGCVASSLVSLSGQTLQTIPTTGVQKLDTLKFRTAKKNSDERNS